MNHQATEFTEKKKKSPRNRILQTVLPILSFILLLFGLPKIVDYSVDTINLNLNKYKWHQFVNSQDNEYYTIYQSCSPQGNHLNIFELDLQNPDYDVIWCFDNASVITNQEFAFAQRCINTLACEVRYDERGFPLLIYFHNPHSYSYSTHSILWVHLYMNED